jgi:hypothetical protein
MKFVGGNGLRCLLSDLKTLLDKKVDKAEKGAAGGVAALDGGGKVPVSQLPLDEYYTKKEINSLLKNIASGAGGDIFDVVNNPVWHPGAKTGGITWNDPINMEFDCITILDTISGVPVFVTNVDPEIQFWLPEVGTHRYLLQVKKTGGGYTSGIQLEETEYSVDYKANLLSAVVPAGSPNHIVLSFDNLVKITSSAGYGISGISDSLVYVDQPDGKTIRLRLASKCFIQGASYSLSYNSSIGNTLQDNNAPVSITDFNAENRSEYSPAAVVSAQIPSLEPSTLVLVMSRPIQINGGFTLSGTSAVIENVVSQGTTIEFALSEPVDIDEAVTLFFNGGAVDDYGQAVAAFTVAVENNSENTPITVHSASIPASNSKQLIVVMEGAVTMESAAGFSLESDQDWLPSLAAMPYSISDGTITFTLPIGMFMGKSFTVSYNGNGSLRCANSNDKVRTFNQAVVNNSTDIGVKPYLEFSSVNTFSLNVYDNTKHWDGTLEYSTNGSTWTTWAGTAAINAGLSGGVYSLLIRGINNKVITGDNTNYRWVLTGSNIACTGNIENLLDYATVAAGGHPAMADYCYSYMFQGCTGLTAAPALPATTLASNCYYYMFRDCTNFKVSSSKTGVYQKSWRIPKSGTVSSEPASWNTSMLYNTGGTFKTDPVINTTYYVENDPVE